jgi:hypothetical protein
MKTTGILSNFDHPAIQSKAGKLAAGKTSSMEKIGSIFAFVRDEIRFGFPPKWDQVKASETLQYGLGYCNTKATLFHALCRAMDIPSRIHTGLIQIRIMRGIFPVFAFPFLPASGGHSWIEVEVDGEWKSIDSYINDKPFYEKALRKLHERGKNTAFSISLEKGFSSCELNFGEKGFVQMGAVIEDHGVWDDFSEYMASDKYFRMNQLQVMVYPIMARMSNINIGKIRSQQ